MNKIFIVTMLLDARDVPKSNNVVLHISHAFTTREQAEDCKHMFENEQSNRGPCEITIHEVDVVLPEHAETVLINKVSAAQTKSA